MRSFVVLCLFAMPAVGQEKEPTLPVEKLTLRAAAAPMPVLRYELLPNYKEQVAGNAALSYHRAMLLKAEIREVDPQAAGKRDERIDEMAAKPLKEIKVEDLSNYLQTYRLIFRELENGARRDHCDWDLEKRIDQEGIGVLLPEVQKMRELARLLSLRCRLHMAEGKIEDAIRDVQIGFSMARHIGDGPTLIQSLVGMAVFNIFAKRLEEIIETDKSPNLYWSLTALPRTLFDMRKPLEGEMRSLEGTLPMLRDLDKGPLTPEQATKLLDQWASGLGRIGGEEWMPPRFALAGLVALHHPKARKALLAMGRGENEINAMPAAQVVLLESLLKFKGMRDELFIWFNMPYAEARLGYTKAEEKFRRMKHEGAGDILQGGLLMLLPAVSKVHFATVRTERRVATLRTIEALRLHAAEHGQWPERLGDVKIVPIPDDPTTGRPFDYERSADGKNAMLYGPPPKGETAHVGNAFKYELNLVK